MYTSPKCVLPQIKNDNADIYKWEPVGNINAPLSLQFYSRDWGFTVILMNSRGSPNYRKLSVYFKLLESHNIRQLKDLALFEWAGHFINMWSIKLSMNCQYIPNRNFSFKDIPLCFVFFFSLLQALKHSNLLKCQVIILGLDYSPALMWFSLILKSHTIQYNTIQYNTIQLS